MVEKIIFVMKIVWFIIGMFSTFYIAGYALCCWLKLECKKCRSMLLGFLFQIAAFELVALPFMLRKGSFHQLLTTYLCVMALWYLGACIFLFCRWRRKIKQTPMEWIKQQHLFEPPKKKAPSLFLLLFWVFAGLHIAGVTTHQITMGDDAYYVTLATYAIEQDTLETNTMFITTGLVTADDIRPNISGWEYYVAALAQVYGFHPAQMFHLLLPFLFIPMSYMAYREVIRELFAKEKVPMYLMWFAVLSLHFSFSNKLNSYNMFNCPWMGKVVLYNILMPLFLAFCIRIMKAQKETLKYWIVIVLIMCAGVCTTVVGVYMIPIYYAVIGITYAVTIRSLQEFKKLVVPVIVTILPVLVVVIVIFTTGMGESILQYAKTEPKKWLSVFYNYWGISVKGTIGWCGLLLFVVSAVVIWFRENRMTKIVLCGITLFCSATIVNPLFIKPVSSCLTGADLYWRMFIMLPVVYVLPYLFTEASLWLEQKHSSLVVVLVLAVSVAGVSLQGSAFANEDIFQPYESTYGIRKECVQISDYLLNHSKKAEKTPNVLYPPALREGLRQYTTKLNTLMGRNYYHNFISTEYGNMKEVTYNIYHQVYSEEETYEVLKALDVDYIVVRKKIKYKNKDHFTKLTKIGTFKVYQVN